MVKSWNRGARSREGGEDCYILIGWIIGRMIYNEWCCNPSVFTWTVDAKRRSLVGRRFSINKVVAIVQIGYTCSIKNLEPVHPFRESSIVLRFDLFVFSWVDFNFLFFFFSLLFFGSIDSRRKEKCLKDCFKKKGKGIDWWSNVDWNSEKRRDLFLSLPDPSGSVVRKASIHGGIYHWP